MKLTVLVGFLALISSKAEELANLRGPAVESHKGKIFSSAEAKLQDQEDGLEKFIMDLSKDAEEKASIDLTSQDGTKKSAGKGSLVSWDYDYNGGNVELSYENFVVSKKWTRPDDCSGKVETVTGQAIGCRSSGTHYSRNTRCVNIEGTHYVRTEGFSNLNCTGEPYWMSDSPMKSCGSYRYGETIECITHDNVPGFTKHDGLVTYKFRTKRDCKDFAYNVLNYRASNTDDYYAEQFDDWYFPIDGRDDDEYTDDWPAGDDDNDDDDRFNHDDDQWQQGGGSGEGAGGGGGGGSGEGVFSLAKQDRQGQPAADGDAEEHAARRHHRHVRQKREHVHHHHDGGDSVEPQAVASTTPNAAHAASDLPLTADAAVTDTATAPAAAAAHEGVGAHPAAAKEVQEIEWHREYAFAQRRNQICSYDEKYQLWVKTSCYGRVNKLVYFLFADHHCTKAIKRVVHDLDDVLPLYGECVQARTNYVRRRRDRRYSLTVCHNQPRDDGDFPMDK